MKHQALYLKLILMAIFAIVLLQDYKVLFLNKDIIYSTYTPLKTFIASLCFGIIISAGVYNIALYIYSKDKRFLFYSLAQFSVLLFLASLDGLHIVPLNQVFTFKSFILHDIALIMILIFSLLFIKYFLSITAEDKILSTMIHGLIMMAFIDVLLTLYFSHSVLTRIFPIFMPIWLVITEAKRLLTRKDSAFYFFYYGWTMVIVISLLVYSNLTQYLHVDFPFLHTIFALESIILSLAITYKMKVLEDERAIQQSLLLQQSRLASMGEMVSTIAHQWRQPLTHLSYIFMNMKKKSDNPEFIKSKIEEGKTQLTYMSDTIEHFSNFYNPNKEKTHFSIKEAYDTAILIASPSLNKVGITLNFTQNDDFSCYGNQNELEQVILNLINNARDILIKRKIQNPIISIMIGSHTLSIADNAGGVEDEYLEKIFEPYFTTKVKSDGIGLYIAKTIIEKEMDGKLDVSNNQEGAVFRITFVEKNY